MNRLLAVFALFFIAGDVLADIAPPPPPKGMKYVGVSNEVVLAKDVSGYVFVEQVSSGPGRPSYSYRKIELNSDKPTALTAGGRRSSVSVFAVPQEAAKEFKSDDDLYAALAENKVKGAHRVGFASTATVSDSIKGDSVTWTHTITAIDEKGVKKNVEGEGSAQPKRSGKSDIPLARAGTWVAGLAAAAALTLGGLWLVGRGRRKV